MPDINFPTVDLEKAVAELNHALKEAAYVAVGLGVLGFQRAQVRRVELMKQLEGAREQIGSEQFETQLVAVRAQLADLAKLVDEWLLPARAQLDGQIDLLEERLPGSARDLVRAMREAAANQEQVLRGVVGLN
jgi:hypothetical protein